MNSETLQSTISSVVDPEFDRSLGELNMVKSVNSEGGDPRVMVELPTPAYPNRDRIVEAINNRLGDAGPVSVDFTWKVKGKDSGGRIGLKAKNVIAVGSGKGGVGKSTIAASLAYGLKYYGAKVGLMDADVYGPSIPHLVGASGQPGTIEIEAENGQKIQRIVPVEADGMKLMSIGFMVEEDQAVIWRGPMLHKLLSQFFQQTEWGELDYLIVDMPPGTGDVALTLSQMVSLAGAVVVCTPQQVALLDAVKAISMFNQVKIPILGMVENMSGEMFGRGGAKAKAEELGVPFLGEIPSEPQIRIRGDESRISSLFSEDNPAQEPLLQMCEQTAIRIAKQILESPSMPTLEVI